MKRWESERVAGQEGTHTPAKRERKKCYKRIRENADKIGGIRNEGEGERKKKRKKWIYRCWFQIISSFEHERVWPRVWVKVESWRAKRRRNWIEEEKEEEKAIEERESQPACVRFTTIVKKKEEASPSAAPPPYSRYIPTSFYRAVILLGAVGVIPFPAGNPGRQASYIYIYV